MRVTTQQQLEIVKDQSIIENFGFRDPSRRFMLATADGKET